MTDVKHKPLHIGELVVESPVMLAPMAGLTDAAMRHTCRLHHCGLGFTEVVNSEGIVRRRARTMHLLETCEGERPVAAHIYGSKPDVMAEAAAIIESLQKFDVVDINCGCPVRKIVGKGAGAALIKNPEKIGQIVRAVKTAVSIPVTVKTRIGFTTDNINVCETVQAVQETGGDAIIIHARAAENKHSGEADWEVLAVAKAASTIPVIGNGGIEAACDALDMLSETGVDGVMIGRAAQGNPWIFDEINCLLQGKPYRPHTPEEHKATIMEHLQRLVELEQIAFKSRKKRKMAPEQYAVCQFRPHLYTYCSGYKGVTELGRSLNAMRTVESVAEAIDRIISLNRS